LTLLARLAEVQPEFAGAIRPLRRGAIVVGTALPRARGAGTWRVDVDEPELDMLFSATRARGVHLRSAST